MKFIKGFLMVLGAVFLILILVASYFIFSTDLFGLKETSVDKKTDTKSIEENYDHPLLNETQEKALETIGIDPAKVPSQITPEMEACFTEKLGKERVNEIKAGASPSATDLFKAKTCLN